MGHDDAVIEPTEPHRPSTSSAPPPDRVIIAGCGRVGAALAHLLDAEGHEVAIIDREPRAFQRLSAGFGGESLTGIVFDLATMVRAGAESAAAFVAVTNGDNSNIVAARTARDHFGIATVVARIYDPERATIYERHGVTTIATARWTTDAILGHLQSTTSRIGPGIGPGAGDVVVLDHDLPAGAGPWSIEQFSRQGRWVPAAITRTGQTTVPVPRQLVQGGERVHLAVQRTAVDEAEAYLRGLGGDVSSAGGGTA
jgi:trk system potassium uptake protein TrkA